MTQPEDSANPVCESVQAALTQAIANARAAIENAGDPHEAFHAVSHAAGTLRDAADDFAELRASIVAQIAEAEQLSLAKLADRVGVSKARAGQLVETGRRVQHLRAQRRVEGHENGEHERSG